MSKLFKHLFILTLFFTLSCSHSNQKLGMAGGAAKQSGADESSSVDQQTVTCPICFAEEKRDSDDMVALGCHHTHIFHKACITHWLVLKGGNKCMLCNQDIPNPTVIEDVKNFNEFISIINVNSGLKLL